MASIFQTPNANYGPAALLALSSGLLGGMKTQQDTDAQAQAASDQQDLENKQKQQGLDQTGKYQTGQLQNAQTAEQDKNTQATQALAQKGFEAIQTGDLKTAGMVGDLIKSGIGKTSDPYLQSLGTLFQAALNHAQTTAVRGLTGQPASAPAPSPAASALDNPANQPPPSQGPIGNVGPSPGMGPSTSPQSLLAPSPPAAGGIAPPQSPAAVPLAPGQLPPPGTSASVDAENALKKAQTDQAAANTAKLGAETTQIPLDSHSKRVVEGATAAHLGAETQQIAPDSRSKRQLEAAQAGAETENAHSRAQEVTNQEQDRLRDANNTVQMFMAKNTNQKLGGYLTAQVQRISKNNSAIQAANTAKDTAINKIYAPTSGNGTITDDQKAQLKRELDAQDANILAMQAENARVQADINSKTGNNSPTVQPWNPLKPGAALVPNGNLGPLPGFAPPPPGQGTILTGADKAAAIAEARRRGLIK